MYYTTKTLINLNKSINNSDKEFKIKTLLVYNRYVPYIDAIVDEFNALEVGTICIDNRSETSEILYFENTLTNKLEDIINLCSAVVYIVEDNERPNIATAYLLGYAEALKKQILVIPVFNKSTNFKLDFFTKVHPIIVPNDRDLFEALNDDIVVLSQYLEISSLSNWLTTGSFQFEQSSEYVEIKRKALK
jgi:hypothetical protein